MGGEDDQKNSWRLKNIALAQNLFASVYSTKSPWTDEQPLTGATSGECFYIQREVESIEDANTVFNMPFLLTAEGKPWYEANHYLCSLVQYKHKMARPTEDVRRKASQLLRYKLFTEENDIDWLDFTKRRPSQRPTYRYFYHLAEIEGLKPAVVNQYTSTVYNFYKHITEHWPDYGIDLERVDSVKTVRVYYQHSTGSGSKDVEVRSQTKSVPPRGNDPIGFVRDDGELLRPLTLDQFAELKSIINSDDWSPIERLIVLFAVMTGARKQTVLTIRLKHVRAMLKNGPERDGTYKLFAGPGTVINTKNSKHQTLYIPSQLVKELAIYADCKRAQELRSKFKEEYRTAHPDLPEINNEDLYLFISNQGNCYYMGKDDPRYPIVKSKPVGQVVENLKRKILRSASEDFPKDFYYHWLRATYAYLLWKALQVFVDSGELRPTAVMGFIQNRLHHTNPETTENYLKLFNNVHILYDTQGAFEDILLGGHVPAEPVSVTTRNSQL